MKQAVIKLIKQRSKNICFKKEVHKSLKHDLLVYLILIMAIFNAEFICCFYKLYNFIERDNIVDTCDISRITKK